MTTHFESATTRWVYLFAQVDEDIRPKFVWFTLDIQPFNVLLTPSLSPVWARPTPALPVDRSPLDTSPFYTRFTPVSRLVCDLSALDSGFKTVLQLAYSRFTPVILPFYVRFPTAVRPFYARSALDSGRRRWTRGGEGGLHRRLAASALAALRGAVVVAAAARARRETAWLRGQVV